MRNNETIVMSDAAWAWEGLRRNRAYRTAWARHQSELPDLTDRHGSVRYLRLERPYLEAEVYGLVGFADPDHTASEVPVLWRPNLLRRTLHVSLSAGSDTLGEGFSLGSLKCCPMVIDSSEGLRHIRIGGHEFWIQLVSDDLIALEDGTRIDVVLSGSDDLPQRITSVEQLFSIHRSEDGKPASVKRPPSREKLLEGLLAWDIYDGPGGSRRSLRDVAVALVGEERVAAEWSQNRSLKDMAVRARDRGRSFVNGGYCDLLRRAAF